MISVGLTLKSVADGNVSKGEGGVDADIPSASIDALARSIYIGTPRNLQPTKK